MLRIGGRKSRNKVIVGEPAIGSLMIITPSRLCRASTICESVCKTVLGDASAYLAKKDETLLDNLSEL